MRVIWLFAQFLGWLGAIFVCYSVIAAFTTSWPPIEEYAAFASALLTITGAVVTAASIYLVQGTSRPAWVTSRFVAAPVVICAGLLAIAALFRTGHISPVLVDGFSLLAVSGSLFRLLPYRDPEASDWRAARGSLGR